MDIRLPPTHTDEGMRAALQIRQQYPGVAVLVLSQYVELGLAMQLLSESAEGVGYLLKDRISDVAEFVDAVRRVAAGGSAIDPKIVSTLLQRRRRDDPLDRLTPREREVLELMAAGTSNQGIADRMVITLRAAEKYVSSVFDKLGIPSTVTIPVGCSPCCSTSGADRRGPVRPSRAPRRRRRPAGRTTRPPPPPRGRRTDGRPG